MVALVVGAVIIAPIVWLAIRLPNGTERRGLRSLLLALLVTPSVVNAPGLHGGFIVPATLLFGQGAKTLDIQMMFDGLVPLTISFTVIWAMWTAITRLVAHWRGQ